MMIDEIFKYTNNEQLGHDDRCRGWRDEWRPIYGCHLWDT
jgi:hypothetical protein